MFGKRILVVLLCFLLTDLPYLRAQQEAPAPAAPQAAAAAPSAPVLVASVTGYTAGATVNDSPLDPNRALHVNDVIKTDANGRVRLRLFGGGMLDAGSQTSFKVLRNDPSVQQTVVELFSGQLRSELPEFKTAAASYELRTAQGRVTGRGGSDMYVQASPGRTVVRVLKGQGTAKAMSSQSTVEIAANQSLELTPAGAGQVRVTPLAVQQEALAQTALSTTTTQAATNAAPPQEQAPPPAPVKKSHLKRNLLILAVIGAAGAGAAAAAAGHGGSSTTTTPPAATGTPTIPPQ